jgi:hypothetical protein
VTDWRKQRQDPPLHLNVKPDSYLLSCVFLFFILRRKADPSLLSGDGIPSMRNASVLPLYVGIVGSTLTLYAVCVERMHVGKCHLHVCIERAHIGTSYLHSVRRKGACRDVLSA